MAKVLEDWEWAIIAAWIDTEGCIDTMVKRDQTNLRISARVRISQKEVAPLIWLHERIGGRLTKEKHRSHYNIRLVSRQVIPVLEGALPYFLLKQPQARLALELQRSKDWKRSEDKRTRQLAIREEISRLNQRK